MSKINILWADDEIDLLKPHLLYLQEKGYDVKAVTNGNDAVEEFGKDNYDIVFLDENMPGISGLETLGKIKKINQGVPVVMITKSEEETIMDDAIGSKISDYLIKPVNPGQILLSIKKNIDKNRLISEKTTSKYQQDFRNIGMTLGGNLNYLEWNDVYKKLIYWELELERSGGDSSMKEVFLMQKAEANNIFAKFVEKTYLDWLHPKTADVPVMSHTIMKSRILPLVEKDAGTTYMILIDNLRLDQWKVLQPIIEESFKTESEDSYYAILPTCTQYARNAIFAGLMPAEIERLHPTLWLNDEEEGGKNMHEEELLAAQLKRLGKSIKFSYNKVTNHETGKRLAESIHTLAGNKLNVIVYNFVDMLSHARTEMEVIRELASDDAAYRSLTVSWFRHSPLHDILKAIAASKSKLIITTDHGTIKVTDPSKIIGDKNTNTNLRYKQGKSLTYQAKDVFLVKNPADAYLPRQHVSSVFVFVKENKFFAYPNNYNYFVNYYKNTFQHGGISLEEMIIPLVVLSPR
ncbi:MAG: bifunctional response regulator/alkaline phosphatase family protein [Bacteroidia bacterium]|nr:bifunctional response regulator/alkaline phosphatase family protein [Bacteroidia bacterium]